MPLDSRSRTRSSDYAELFVPKLITVLREGYGAVDLRADAVAGLTVAIVALPLSMAIAVASGVSPAQGLTTAIIGGFIVSLLGGSRFQIGGPAGAFIVLVAGTVQTHGPEGLILATMLSGLMLAALGFLRLGTYVKFIPYPVTVGFTAGIAVIIAASQITPLLGLTIEGEEPGPFLDKLPVLLDALPTATPAAIAVGLATIAIIVGIGRFRPRWPGMLVAVAAGAVATALGLPVETIGSQFGGIPAGLPAPAMPEITLAKIQAVLPNAVAFTLLGAIESLLSAVVADGMTGRRHRSNCELVAQGVANVAAALFGGFCVTGTIARTATNVRAGARGPVAGMLHAAFLLGFILVAAPLAAYIPLASLAGVLAVVAWNMIEKDAIAVLFRTSGGDAAVLGVTFALTVFRDLTEAIVVGFSLGALLFIGRMSRATEVERYVPPVLEDRPDRAEERTRYDESIATDPAVVVYRISGAFFFGAAASVGAVLERIAARHEVLILDFEAVPLLDSTAANMLEGLARKTARRDVRLIFTGTTREVRRTLFAQGLKPPRVRYERTLEVALARARVQRS